MQWLQLREEEESMSSSMETPIVSMRKWNDMIWYEMNRNEIMFCHLLIWFDCVWLYLFICWFDLWYDMCTVLYTYGVVYHCNACMNEWLTDIIHCSFFYCIALHSYDTIWLIMIMLWLCSWLDGSLLYYMAWIGWIIYYYIILYSSV